MLTSPSLRHNRGVEPSPAATVVLARDAPAGVEVAVLRRSRANRFAPGFVVFPGGMVEPRDEGLAEGWFGDRSELWRACAVREVAEETGVALTASGVRTLAAGEDLIAAVAASPPPVGLLPEVARWVAPECLSVRFDARFFAARAASELPLRADGVEADLAWWARPAELLDELELYETLMWPTHRMLQALADCRSTDEVTSLWVEQEPPPPGGRARSPEWRPDGPGARYGGAA